MFIGQNNQRIIYSGSNFKMIWEVKLVSVNSRNEKKNSLKEFLG